MLRPARGSVVSVTRKASSSVNVVLTQLKVQSELRARSEQERGASKSREKFESKIIWSDGHWEQDFVGSKIHWEQD